MLHGLAYIKCKIKSMTTYTCVVKTIVSSRRGNSRGSFWGAGNPGGWFLCIPGLYVLGNLLALLRQDSPPLRTVVSVLHNNATPWGRCHWAVTSLHARNCSTHLGFKLVDQSPFSLFRITAGWSGEGRN